jgi:hypothetical protein
VNLRDSRIPLGTERAYGKEICVPSTLSWMMTSQFHGDLSQSWKIVLEAQVGKAISM